ncbi:hypothetical protein O181_012174 [Austropuccinia psidii MF-1]|uniref:RNase H type-1 domain-containing protein n=1 Tax=Austropuccinia psidii MF-1 TaxID=1389203 RepID=A0A9Q3BVW5_9BASI|nr:hypothetical protein [Austropuccinia psidii MF-1]
MKGAPVKPNLSPLPLSQILMEEDLLKCHKIDCETILTLPNTPWAQPISQKHVPNKEQAREVLPNQAKDELKKGTLVLFSDGSLLPQQGGGAAVTLKLIQDHITTHGHPAEVALFSDNQAALSSAILPKKKSAAQHLQLKLYTNLQKWVKHFPVCLYGFLGHVGIPENKRVDTLAKHAAESQDVSPYTINTISISN